MENVLDGAHHGISESGDVVRGKSEQSAFAGKFNRNSPGRSSVGM